MQMKDRAELANIKELVNALNAALEEMDGTGTPDEEVGVPSDSLNETLPDAMSVEVVAEDEEGLKEGLELAEDISEEGIVEEVIEDLASDDMDDEDDEEEEEFNQSKYDTLMRM